MDNAQKAIMIGVGLFITILVIAAVMLIVNVALDMLSGATENISNLSAAFQEQLIREYDDVTVTGAKVKAAIDMYCTDEDMILEVQPISGGTILELGKLRGNGTTSIDKPLEYDSSNVQTKVSALSDSTNSETYVPSTARYHAQVVRSSTGDAVLGLIFTREN